MRTSGRAVNWVIWHHMPNVQVYEAVALSLGIDPRKVKFERNAWTVDGSTLFDEGQNFNDRMMLANANLQHLKVAKISLGDSSKTEITLASFAALAKKLEWTIPDEMREIANDGDGQSAIEINQVGAHRWPWGDHSTRRLELLADAAKQFWSTYDPEQSSTAPTNKDVADYLVSKGESRSLADAIASILRADDVQPGRRKVSAD
jgi:hypothetical protein